MKIKLTKAQTNILIIALLRANPKLTNGLLKKEFRLNIGKDAFTNAQNQAKKISVGTIDEPTSISILAQKLSELSTLEHVAEFCRNELRCEWAYEQLHQRNAVIDVNAPIKGSENRQNLFHRCILYDNKEDFDRYLPQADLRKTTLHGETPLMLLCGSPNESDNQIYYLNKILAFNQRDIALNHQGPQGFSALHSAAQFGNYALVNALLNKGINPNLKNEAGYTAIELAIFNSITYPKAMECARLMNENHQIRVTHSFKETLLTFIINNKLEQAHLAIDCGADPNQEILREQNSACLFQIIFLSKIVDGTFCESDKEILRFFSECGYDFSKHKNIFLAKKDKSLYEALPSYLAQANRVDELKLLSKYLPSHLNIPDPLVHLRKVTLKSGDLLIGLFGDYYPIEEIDSYMQDQAVLYERMYEYLSEQITKIIPVESDTPLTISDDKKSREELNQSILYEVNRQKKISHILEQIKRVEERVKETDKRTPKWIQSLKATIEKYDLNTLDSYLETVTAWADKTIMMIGFCQNASEQEFLHQEIMNLGDHDDTSSTFYESRYSLDQLHPVLLENHKNFAVLNLKTYPL